MILSPYELDRIRMDVDLEMRKAKAALDQIPDQPAEHLRMKAYLRLMKMGTALAVRENPDTEPPVPMLVFHVDPFLNLPIARHDNVIDAWDDLDGNTINDGGFMEPSTITMTTIPIYPPVNDGHRTINTQLIAEKDWFSRQIAQASFVATEASRLTRRINACNSIIHEAEALTHDPSDPSEGASSPQQEWQDAG